MNGCYDSDLLLYGCIVAVGQRLRRQLQLGLEHVAARDSDLGATVAGCVIPRRIARCARNVAGARRDGESESC